MKKRLEGMIWIGLGVSLGVALFLAPFGSSAPDGLERTAQTIGLEQKARVWSFWKAPLSGYAIPAVLRIANEKISTALSGLLGTLAIFLMALGLGKLLRKTVSHSTSRRL